MTEQQDLTPTLPEEVAQPTPVVAEPEQVVENETVDGPAEVAEAVNGEAQTNGAVGPTSWHSEAGRKGAHRVHELIERGRLYEQEHGLTSGRQRLRQLVELGKLYEQEHGLRPRRKERRGERLSRLGRKDVLRTFLRCLVRIAKPSLRGELTRMVEALEAADVKDQAA